MPLVKRHERKGILPTLGFSTGASMVKKLFSAKQLQSLEVPFTAVEIPGVSLDGRDIENRFGFTSLLV